MKNHVVSLLGKLGVQDHTHAVTLASSGESDPPDDIAGSPSRA